MEWTAEWPTQNGHYWFYGWCWKSEANKPEMHFVRVGAIATPGKFAYVTNGHFLFVGEGAEGKWLKAELPEPPMLSAI